MNTLSELTKAECIRRHAVRRAWERFDLKLTDELHDKIVTKLKRKKGALEEVSCRIWIFRLKVEGKMMDIVYDRKRELLVTFKFPVEKVKKTKEGE